VPSSPTYTVVDQFDGDEFLDIPKAPAALLAALNTVPDPRKPTGLRHQLAWHLDDRGMRGQQGDGRIPGAGDVGRTRGDDQR